MLPVFPTNNEIKLIALLYANWDLFTSDLSELPGTDLMTHTIDTGDARPIKQQPF